MKKIRIILIFIFSLFVTQISSAASGSHSPNGLNHLSLSNLKVHPYVYTAETISNIRLVKDRQYTMVIDFDTLGRHLSNLGDLWIEVEFFPGPYSGDIYFQTDMINSRVYVEFVAEDQDLRISAMPIDDESNTYNIILFEGTYNQFPGFEPYLHPLDRRIVEGVLPMDYDQRLSAHDINNLIIARDPYGNPLPKTLMKDTYSNSSQLPGTYQMILSTIYNQVQKHYILDIKVIDITAPVIHSTGTINISLSQKKPVNEIVQSLHVTDNVDTILFSDLVITEDTYSTATTLGAYHIKVKATDRSGNHSEKTISIALVDLKAPSITGPSSIYVYSTDVPLTNEQIKSKFTAFDDVDGSNVTVTINFNQYAQTMIPGRYTVEIGASDSKGNTTTFISNIHVIDNRGPNFVVDTKILSKTTAMTMTDAEIIEWFKNQMLNAGLSTSLVRIVYNEYKEQSGQAGQYYVYLSYEQDGIPGLSRILMDVTDEQEKQIPLYVWIPLSILSVAFSTLIYLKLKKR